MSKIYHPIISIITPTFNRANEIKGLIQSIQNQSIDPNYFEMIIADDGSTDETEMLINDTKKKLKFDLRYFTQNNQGPGAARNLGIEKSRGELILFIDSDCEADSQWIETIYHTFQTEPFDACGGPDASKSDFTPFQKAVDYSLTSFLTTGGMRGHSQKMLAKFYPRSHNMGMTKPLIDKVGGFGNLRHGQDIELSHRIIKSGANVSFIPEAIVYHRRRTTLKLFFKQTFNWGVARINLYKIDKSLLEPIHFLPAIGLCLGIFSFVGTMFSINIFQLLFFTGILAWVVQCIFGAIHHKDIKVFFHLLQVIPSQIMGYGLGFITAFIKRILFNSKVYTGFEKSYYSN
jgi:glycosyltransferase involved in cell wall biosynthesis